ncbi:hypothetical protein SZ64_10515 [Erythrobacter sp. SG61-1L]|uniref:sensor histidine kinase n=1 Tax=Erythrobacter sp. SG61-1L TaxID=1603897 RepID=UPI0006C92BCD|nr:histidine kinase [Erythrobacter sp. SG61-1L]KPL68498.1 hypothetical protein SZ64_10515 [Erythrobacter sp. SG61-1L]
MNHAIAEAHDFLPAEPLGGDLPAMRPAHAVPFWLANLAVWVFISLLGVSTRTLFFGNFTDALVVTLALDAIGFALTTLAHEVLRRRPRPHFPAMGVVLLVVLASIGGGAVEMLAAEGLRGLSFSTGEFQQAYGGRIVPLLYYMAIFMGWALGYFWLTADVAARTEQLHRSEAQSAATRAELQQLKVQLDPHFLFNALNTLTAEIPERPDVALEMVHGISAYMRYCLDHRDRSACALASEIEATRAYLRIQELRFDAALTCGVDLDPEAADFPVPHLILQGLLENAVKHGLRPTTGAPLRIHVGAQLRNGVLEVLVSNPGKYAPGQEMLGGLGLINIRRRLELHYPGRHHFSITQEEDRVVARMILQGAPCFA